MKNCSPPRSTRGLSNYSIQDNCDCICHFQEECKMDNFNCDMSFQNKSMCNNMVNIHCISPCISHSPSPNRIRAGANYDSDIRNISRNMSSNCLCVCDKICSCPCHCVACVCCPCVKDRQDTQTSTTDYYKNLYEQIKSELELEKKRNERMKYDRQMHKNNLQNFENEKNSLLYQNEQLKNKLDETLAKLQQEEDKNNRREQELFSFKQEELPKLQESYETLITKIKEKYEKQINCLNNQMNNLAKENVSMKYQLQRKQNDERNSLDKIIEELNNEINDLKVELENRNRKINDLKNENEDLNNQLEDINTRYKKDIRELKDLKNKNMKLSQTISMNVSEINRLKDELNRLKKDKSLGDENIYNLKAGNENKDNEINSLKILLSKKDEENEALANELEKLKIEYNNLSANYTEAAQHIESLADLEQKYVELLNENNQLKKDNEENKNIK